MQKGTTWAAVEATGEQLTSCRFKLQNSAHQHFLHSPKKIVGP